MTTESWHRAYRNWYDHDRVAHRVVHRVAVWGWIADRLANGA